MTRTRAVTCDTLLEQISAYLDEDLSAARCAAIERHAKTCPACARIIDDFRKTTGICRAAATAPLPPTVRQLARARIKKLMESP